MAANPDVVRYLREQVNAGFSKERVYQALLDAGWTKEQVNEAIYEIMGKKPQARPATAAGQAQSIGKDVSETPGFFWKLKNSLFHPGRFFEAVKPETGIGNAFIFMLTVSMINFLAITSIFLYANRIPSILLIGVLDSSSLGAAITFSVLVFAFAYMASLGLGFLLAGITHGIVRLAGGNKGFYQTYKGVGYACAPLIFMLAVYFVSFLFLDYANVQTVLGGVELLIAFWGLYLAVKGISKFQEISVMKAIVAVALTSITVVFILFLGAFYFLYSLVLLLGLV